MFNWLKPKFTQDWRLVKSLHVDVSYSFSRAGIKLSEQNGKIYYHLFESNTNSRRVEFQSTIKLKPDELDVDAKTERLYQEKIYPWLNGRVDPDIPRYSQIPEEETAVMLRGKKI